MESKIIDVESIEFNSLIEEFENIKQRMVKNKYSISVMLEEKNRECNISMIHYNEIRNNILNSIESYIDSNNFEIPTALKLMSVLVNYFNIDKVAIIIGKNLLLKIIDALNKDTKSNNRNNLEYLYNYKNYTIDEISDTNYLIKSNQDRIIIDLSKIDYTYMFNIYLGSIYNNDYELIDNKLIIYK